VNGIDPLGLAFEIHVGWNPGGGYAQAWGPFVILYGPSYRAQNEKIQYVIRAHEYLHTSQFGWGYRDLWDYFRGNYNTREYEAWKLTRDMFDIMLFSPNLDEETRKELEKWRDDAQWRLDNKCF
jgi:hypothetical protein